ncbi:ADP-ribose pyrophosphatase [Peptostreptococcaceae bacterium pGA-8]|nr:ADP-ribose pyrophosphatase [Peptostreptococcaceae bacterium pGA-8]
MIFVEKTIESKRIYEGRILNLRVDTVKTIDGESTREIIEHNGGAVIAAITDDYEMLMVKQFRKPLERVVLEAPAGKLDKGEKPETTALRELKEETGYTAENIKFITKIYPSVGYCQEALYLYVCTNLKPGEPSFDEGEAIELCKYPIDELAEMVLAGKIEDAKTQVTVLIVKSMMDRNEL